ncbi:MAG: glycosyltransferase family 4 protein, partial [Terriglobia bacterium]
GRAPQFTTHLFQEPWTFWLPKKAEIFHSLAQRPAPFHFRNEVVTVNDVFPLVGRGYSTPEFQRRFSALLLEAVKRAARVITPSQYSAAQLCKYAGARSAKIRVIPDGVDIPAQRLGPEARFRERERWVGPGNELVLVVGVIQTRKNTLGALRSLGRLPDRYRMVLAGGNGYGSGAAHDFMRESGLSSRVIVAGHVTSSQLAALYECATVFLFPSFEEGFGLPVLEAMAYGLPVVASNTASLPEVGGEAALYANPNDEIEIADRVLKATQDKSLRQRMIAAGVSRARQFPWSLTAQRTLQVYEELL